MVKRDVSCTGGPTAPVDPTTADETLNGVLRSVINEFLHGDFEMIRVFVSESKNRFTSQIH